MSEIQILPYVAPSARGNPIRKRKHKARRVSRSYLRQLEKKAQLVKLCRANGFPQCSPTVANWKLRKYLKERGIRTY